MSSPLRIAAIGDSTLVVELGSLNEADARVNARAVEIAAAVQAAAIGGVLDVVPTFQTVAVYFDPLRTDVDELSGCLRRATTSELPRTVESHVLHRVPVWYGGAFGPDLAEVAAAAKLSEPAVVSLHAAPIYRVYMLGFTPGFAYLGSLDSTIAQPRRATPRASVPAGSVAIAGRQTGIYPSASPGGWHIIGRTPLRPFVPERAEPFLFKPGDNVQFYPIDPASRLEG
jgi:KipI family sensor histidine kinase inhibitor